jgi:hypothetical protein
MDFSGGICYRSWADNSNSTGNNPDGTAGQDIYTAEVTVAGPSRTANVQYAALDGLTNGAGLNGAGALTDQQATNENVMNLAGTSDLFGGVNGGKKKMG